MRGGGLQTQGDMPPSVDEYLNGYDQCAFQLEEISNVAEQLSISGRSFPVSLRMEICERLDLYNDYMDFQTTSG